MNSYQKPPLGTADPLSVTSSSRPAWRVAECRSVPIGSRHIGQMSDGWQLIWVASVSRSEVGDTTAWTSSEGRRGGLTDFWGEQWIGVLVRKGTSGSNSTEPGVRGRYSKSFQILLQYLSQPSRLTHLLIKETI